MTDEPKPITDAAEIKRLREALNDITLCIPIELNPDATDQRDDFKKYITDIGVKLASAISIARAALTGGE